MNANWKALEALRERRLLIAAQSATQAALEAARRARAADQSVATVVQVHRARLDHDSATRTPDASGSIAVATLQQAGAWTQVLSRAIQDATQEARAAAGDARDGHAAAAKARLAAARATGRRDAARKGLERDRQEALERLERQDELRAEAQGHARWSADAARAVD